MKRKKWTEEEEETLITKYADLQATGTLTKLKTREKKFQPIADQVNSRHHLRDPISFPFRWSWRDVSIKVQNMRHQYMGVKQKIRVSDGEFNWDDGQDHWPNFFKYKQVFGDVELDVKKAANGGGDYENDVIVLEAGDHGDDDDNDDDDDDDVDGSYDVDGNYDVHDEAGRGLSDLDSGFSRFPGSIGVKKRFKKNGELGFIGSQVLELRDALGKREEKRREREFLREEEVIEKERRDKEKEELWKMREKRLDCVEFEWEERQRMWARREMERRLRIEREFEEDRRRWLMKMEEKREEEEMAWRERMVELQIEHEKQIMQIHADACHGQMQVLGVLGRIVCQFFGGGNDGLGGSGLGGLTPQILQNLQHHPGSLVGDNVKPDANSDTHFM